MCHFCNTTPPKPYKILNDLLSSDLVPPLTCVYVLVRPTFWSFFLPKKQQQTWYKKAISGTALVSSWFFYTKSTISPPLSSSILSSILAASFGPMATRCVADETGVVDLGPAEDAL